MTPATPLSFPKNARAPVDQVGKRILAHIAQSFTPDASAIARDIGAREEVVRDRIAAMRESGLLRGIDLRVDPDVLGQRFEYLVSGVPTGTTDRAAISRLCTTPGVTRVFGLASSHSVAFTIRGNDPAQVQQRGLELARVAGLLHTQAVMIVSTFHDRTGLDWGERSPVDADAAGPVC
jgi:DNA-binding Lrp family transcriptional regulator